MFTAYFQPPRPKTKGSLLFYFLKLYNFGFYEIFVGSAGSELQHPWISKIKCEPSIGEQGWWWCYPSRKKIMTPTPSEMAFAPLPRFRAF